ncbi:glycosyltransferase [Spongiibacter marinus]|uniref:glycosyltransferase n=1 Tax=Spongiibacter marinus TaxID=354246 RepID=UPI003562E17E
MKVSFFVCENSGYSQFKESLGELPKCVEVTLADNIENIGFGRGHNKNFIEISKHAKFDSIVVANSDIEILDGSLLKNLHQASGGEHVVSPQIVTPAGEGWYAGGTIGALTGDLRINRRLFRSGFRKTEFMCGCFFMMPRVILKDVGGFSEDYFMYAEDLEFSIRVVRSGCLMYVVDEKIIHRVGSGSDGEYSPLYLYENTKNRRKCLNDNKLGVYPISKVFFFIKYFLARYVQLFLIGDSVSFKYVMRAFK